MDSKTSIFSARRSAYVGALLISLLIGGAVLSAPSVSQKFTIRVLNAKTGKAIGNKKVTVKWADGVKSIEVLLDNNGRGKVEMPSEAQDFFVMEGPRIGKEPDRIAYIDCNDPSMAVVHTTQVMEKGVVPHNKCGHQTVLPQPGELVFWALPLPWWRPDLQ
jgi:hypothetical protein